MNSATPSELAPPSSPGEGIRWPASEAVPQTLSETECARLLGLASELYTAPHPRELLSVLFRGLQGLIPHELGGCHRVRPARRQVDTHYAPARHPPPLLPQDFWRLTVSHPLNRLLLQHPLRAWKLTDAISHRDFLATEVYHALYRPLAVDRELVAALPVPDEPGAYLQVSLHRRRADFTEHDRAILNLLLPHLDRAWRRLAATGSEAPRPAGLWNGEKSFTDWLRAHTRWRLTPRESEVLYWLSQGKTNSEIGCILGIAERTAETHALRLYPKMGVENRFTAIATLNRLALQEMTRGQGNGVVT
ncbi:MAG TPA: helix-turn-helix transcriptional regulator [Methylomirabilota bacterium]|nr:helix-turn-helix transcriptional regulator [Methylomirabilota bacterium]